ncbi:hypothetical protein GN956_G3958 [Arapaima gigas]
MGGVHYGRHRGSAAGREHCQPIAPQALVGWKKHEQRKKQRDKEGVKQAPNWLRLWIPVIQTGWGGGWSMWSVYISV